MLFRWGSPYQYLGQRLIRYIRQLRAMMFGHHELLIPWGVRVSQFFILLPTPPGLAAKYTFHGSWDPTYSMSQAQWLDVEESEESIVFEEFERGDLACGEHAS